jgi:hypothetical protein
MKKQLYTFLILTVTYISAAAQSPWTPVDIPHPDTSVLNEIEIPNANTVWATYYHYNVNTSSAILPFIFLKTGDAGATWMYDTIRSAGGVTDGFLSSLSPLDADTCYAAIYNGADKSKTIVSGFCLFLEQKSGLGSRRWH